MINDLILVCACLLFVLQSDRPSRGASQSRTSGAGAADQGPAGQDLCRKVQHTEERGEDPEDGDGNEFLFQNLKVTNFCKCTDDLYREEHFTLQNHGQDVFLGG